MGYLSPQILAYKPISKKLVIKNSFHFFKFMGGMTFVAKKYGLHFPEYNGSYASIWVYICTVTHSN